MKQLAERQEAGAVRRLVVIGNGMAGVAAVEQVLKIRRDLSITIFGEEPHVNYNRILLSDVLAGKRAQEKIHLNTLQWYEDHGIDLRRGVRVTGIDPVKKTVTDSTGAVAPYDRLLVAVGGKPVIPPIRGTEKEGVHVFRNLQDAQGISARALLVKQAVVVGGGLLGLEAARALVHHGVSVTVVHLMGHLMEQQLDAGSGAILKREVERLGIGVLLNTTTEEILGSAQVEGVRLGDGRELAAGMVLVCAGIRPDLELARAAGLKTNRGIVVQDDLRTSVPDVYAVGDVIEHRDRTYGLVAPLQEQARVVADQLVGMGKLHYEGTVCATTLKVAGINLTSAGTFQEQAGRESVVYMDSQAAVYKKLVFERNRLVGMILLGDNQDGPRLFNFIKSGEDVSALKPELIRTASRQMAPPAEDGFSPVDRMSDADPVCNCHNVTKGTICRLIQEKGIKSREGIAAETQATTGCGSCAQLVDDLLAAAGRPKPVSTPVNKPAAAQLPEPVLKDRPTLGYPEAYPKSLDLEKIKQEGLGLDFEKIRSKGVMALTADDYYRLKTYGVCSQKHPGYFMVRIRIPGGRLSARKLLELADLAEIHGRSRAHLTTRQNMELHWVRVEEVPEIWEKLEAMGLSTRSSCGHTMRNVVACPHGGISRDGILDVWPVAKAVSDHFVARSDLINPTMPNRLNVYFAGCPRCAPDAQINDIGFVAVRRPGGRGAPDEAGFELWAGGSLGAHPMLGIKLKEFILIQDALAACQAIFHLHTKYGNRNKAKSRLKWLLDQWGREKFTRAFERAFEGRRTLPENKGFSARLAEKGHLMPAVYKRLQAGLLFPSDSSAVPAGCHLQKQQGYLWMKVGAPLGEFRSEQLRVLAKLSRRYGSGELHLTPEQDVELHWVRSDGAQKILRTLKASGLQLKGAQSGASVVACPGTEFCVLAVTNAQGAAREILNAYRPRDPGKARLLQEVSIHISGCPNSCAKHQVADIGLAGTLSTQDDGSRYSYMLFLGGTTEAGVRLGQMVRKGITEERILAEIDTLLDVVLENRRAGESFRQVVERMGAQNLAEVLQSRLTPQVPTSLKPVPMRLGLAKV